MICSAMSLNGSVSKMSKVKGIKALLFLVIILAFLCLNITLSFAEGEDAPEITALTLGNWGTYPAADIWMTCGADFENVTDDDTVQLFLTDSVDKTESSAILAGSECSVKDVPKSHQMGKILGEKLEFGFLIHDLEPGQYYVGCKVSSNDNVAYKYSSFVIFTCAKDYVKAALDKVIYSYIKEPDGWYWSDGQYVGLGYRTDVYGNSWESWMFPALGTHYTMNDGTILDFSKDGPVLSAYDGRWFKDLAFEWPITGKQSKLWNNISINELSKHIIAFCAYGENPRDVNNLDLVMAGGQALYKGDGTVPYDENGLFDPGDRIGCNYFLLALEIAGITPKEGYTRLVRDSNFKSVWDYSLDEPESYNMITPDSFAMCLLALPVFKKYPQYEVKINEMINNASAIVDHSIFANGAMKYSSEFGNNDKFGDPNSDSIAVVINMLVMSGFKVEDFDNGMYTKQYGSLLTSLGSCIVEDGVIYGDSANRMATYQTLGALIDLYNNRSCFEIAAEKYKEAHPEYFTDNYGKLSIKSISNIQDQQYTGEAIEPKLDVIGELPSITPIQPVYGTVLPTERALEEGLDYTVEYKNNVEPGEATAIITGIGDYYGTTEVKFNIVKEQDDDPVVITKKKQPMAVKPVLKKVSFKTLKKKAQIVKGALIVKKNQGKVTYKKLKGSSPKLTINTKTGKITVKKKTKKGTYKIKVKVTAAGNKLYKAGSKTVTVKIRVK